MPTIDEMNKKCQILKTLLVIMAIASFILLIATSNIAWNLYYAKPNVANIGNVQPPI